MMSKRQSLLCHLPYIFRFFHSRYNGFFRKTPFRALTPLSALLARL